MTSELDVIALIVTYAVFLGVAAFFSGRCAARSTAPRPRRIPEDYRAYQWMEER